MKRNLIILAVALALVVTAIFVNMNKDEAPKETVAKIGFLAPNFSLPTMDGKQMTFDHANLNKPVLINLWASWCGPCQDEAPSLEAAYGKFKDKVDFYAVNLSTWEYYGMDKMEKFVDEYQLTMPVLLDEDGDVAKGYEAFSAPTTLLINTAGVIEHIYYGPFVPSDLEARLRKMN